jgi:glycosyltransferase involved in cell wall biosynthesis
MIELIREGGMVHYASQLSNALSKMEDVRLSAILPEDADCDIFSYNITIRRVPVIRKNPHRFDTLFKQILYVDPDIVHILIKHPWFIPIVPLLKLKKYPLVVTIHDIESHEGERSFIASISSNMLMKWADEIFVHGEKLKNQLADKGVSRDKIIVIPHGDYSFFTEYKNDTIKEEDAVLFFGRIVDYKGLEYLIKAEPLITKQFPDIKIIVAGGGDFSGYERLIANKKKFEIVNKFIPDKQVAELFQRTRIVVLPYIEASQSGIIPIAYAFKKPVVATDVGAIPEVVDDGVTGFIVPPRDSDALAEAIIKLLQDEKLRKRMGENAYIKMKEELSWDKIAEKTIEVYKEAINEHKNKRRK